MTARCELGADYIEQDLQVTSDGVLVVLHDGTLNRTVRGDAANCTGNVGLQDARADQDLQRRRVVRRRVGGPEGPDARGGLPALRQDRQLLHRDQDAGPEDHMEEKLLALLDKYDLRERSINDWQVLIQSFSADSLRIVQRWTRACR